MNQLSEFERFNVCFQDQLRIEPAIAAMHGPHSVFDIGQYTVIHCDAGDVLLVDQ